MFRKLVIVLGLVSIPVISAAASKSYQIILSGRDAGTQTVEYQADGQAKLFYEFNDRGRGDKITSQLQLNELGLPISMDNEGNDYMKAPVSEHFRMEGQSARWQSGAGEGQIELNAPAFYIPLDGTPEMSGVLARALLQAPNQTLNIIPAGRATIREMMRKTVQVADSNTDIVLYFIEGLGFSPEPIWLETDGTSFGFASPWFSILPAEAQGEVGHREAPT